MAGHTVHERRLLRYINVHVVTFYASSALHPCSGDSDSTGAGSQQGKVGVLWLLARRDGRVERMNTCTATGHDCFHVQVVIEQRTLLYTGY